MLKNNIVHCHKISVSKKLHKQVKQYFCLKFVKLSLLLQEFESKLLLFVDYYIFLVVDNFKLTIQNALVSVVDHQNAKINSVDALQHVISKCSENIDLFIKVSFGTSARSLLTPQVNQRVLYIFIIH